MTYLVVDGYNAMYAIPYIRKKMNQNLQDARREILNVSKEYSRSSGFIDQVKVVFDGDNKYRYLDRIDLARDKAVIFSDTDDGDDKIIRVIRSCSEKGNVVVASNDNYLRNNARGYGASLIRVQDLVSKKRKKRSIPGKKKISKKLSDEITQEYRKSLGI